MFSTAELATKEEQRTWFQSKRNCEATQSQLQRDLCLLSHDKIYVTQTLADLCALARCSQTIIQSREQIREACEFISVTLVIYSLSTMTATDTSWHKVGVDRQKKTSPFFQIFPFICLKIGIVKWQKKNPKPPVLCKCMYFVMLFISSLKI